MIVRMFKGHQAVYKAVNSGLLEPVTAIDANGNDLGTVYILTDWAKQRYDASHAHSVLSAWEGDRQFVRRILKPAASVIPFKK
jgi:hypothetical protein